MAVAHSSISGVIFPMEGVVLAFRIIKFSLQIVSRTALNMSEKVACPFWCQAVSSTLSSSSWPSRCPIRHTRIGTHQRHWVDFPSGVNDQNPSDGNRSTSICSPHTRVGDVSHQAFYSTVTNDLHSLPGEVA